MLDRRVVWRQKQEPAPAAAAWVAVPEFPPTPLTLSLVNLELDDDVRKPERSQSVWMADPNQRRIGVYASGAASLR